jgi:SPASM domain peptide maturase of grasp-with-spasm system
MVEILDLLKQKISVEDIVIKFGHENTNTINEYLSFLIENELGHYLKFNEFDLFPDLELDFDIAYPITNAIVEYSEKNTKYIRSIVAELKYLKCKHIQLVFYEFLELSKLLEYLFNFRDNDFRSIELVLKYDDVYFDNMKNIEKANFSITKVDFHSANKNYFYRDSKLALFDINLSTKQLENFSGCGCIHMNSFVTNIKSFTEFKNYNSCLNRKISVDLTGKIKNCPSMSQSFGNIKDVTLQEALNNKDFKKYWNITKDDIEVCQDCEFRYICTDCRAYLESPSNKFSKPLKCGYDPYTNKWSEWSTNPLKQNSIEYYGLRNLIKKTND